MAETRGVHCVVALALPAVVAFDLSIAAQIFGHRDEASRYDFAVCAPAPGPVPSSTGFAISATRGLEALVARGFDDATLQRTAVLDPADTVPGDVRRILDAPTVSDAISVSGYSYDVATGLVTEVVRPTSRHSTADR